jgi:hypothetical protein
MVNQDAGKFSIWPANTGSKTADIVAVDKQNNMVSDFCVNSTDDSPRAMPLPTSSANPPPQKETSKMPGSVIGGIVGGAVAGIAILGAIGLFLYRRRASRGAATHVAPEAELHTIDVKPPTYVTVRTVPQELPGNRYDVTELDSRVINSSRY